MSRQSRCTFDVDIPMGEGGTWESFKQVRGSSPTESILLVPNPVSRVSFSCMFISVSTESDHKCVKDYHLWLRSYRNCNLTSESASTCNDKRGSVKNIVFGYQVWEIPGQMCHDSQQSVTTIKFESENFTGIFTSRAFR